MTIKKESNLQYMHSYIKKGTIWPWVEHLKKKYCDLCLLMHLSLFIGFFLNKKNISYFRVFNYTKLLKTFYSRKAFSYTCIFFPRQLRHSSIAFWSIRTRRPLTLNANYFKKESNLFNTILYKKYKQTRKKPRGNIFFHKYVLSVFFWTKHYWIYWSYMEFTTDMTFKTAKPILQRIKREKNGLLLCCVMLHKTNNIKQMFMISGVMKISTSGYFQ